MQIWLRWLKVNCFASAELECWARSEAIALYWNNGMMGYGIRIKCLKEKSISRIPFRNYDARSLVAKPIPFPAIRTRPGDGVTGHAPHIFLHASLADTKTAAARPAKRKCHSTTIAVIIFNAMSFFPVCGSGGRRFHDCCFKSLML